MTPRQIAIKNKDITYEAKKPCKDCGNFTRYKNGDCIKCVRDYQKTEEYKTVSKKWQQSDSGKESFKKYHKTTAGAKRSSRSRLKTLYNITEYDWIRMYEEQDGKCILPSCNFTHHPRWWEQGMEGFHVDHNHKTGKVRGLMCPKHNRNLGSVEKDRQIFYEMIDYLDHNNEKVIKN